MNINAYVHFSQVPLLQARTINGNSFIRVGEKDGFADLTLFPPPHVPFETLERAVAAFNAAIAADMQKEAAE